jgi:hypothetical protein
MRVVLLTVLEMDTAAKTLISLSETPHDHDRVKGETRQQIKRSDAKENTPPYEVRSPCKPDNFKQFDICVTSLNREHIHYPSSELHGITLCGPSRSRGRR